MITKLGKDKRDLLAMTAIAKGLTNTDFFLAGIRLVQNNSSDGFDDILMAVTIDEAYSCPGTTKTGVYGTQNPVTYKGKTGGAWLFPDFYKDVYVLGIHGRSNPAFAHEAFIQCGTFKFFRDENMDGDIDLVEAMQIGDDTGINFHRASSQSNVARIGLYGIGCQVVQDHEDLEKFVSLWKSTDTFKKDQKAKISYLLIEGQYAKERGII